MRVRVEADTRAEVLARDGFACIRCGNGDGGMPLQVHHRQPRGSGGSSDPASASPVNLITLCLTCHAWAESYRKQAEAMGFIVRHGIDPVSVPVRLRDGYLWLLRHDGGKTPQP